MRDIHKMGRSMVSLLWIFTKNKTKSYKTKTQTTIDEKGKRGELVVKYQNSNLEHVNFQKHRYYKNIIFKDLFLSLKNKTGTTSLYVL